MNLETRKPGRLERRNAGQKTRQRVSRSLWFSGFQIEFRSCFPHFLIQTNSGIRADKVSNNVEEVQKRREFPVRFVQRLQIMVHRRINGRAFGSGDSFPFIPRLFAWFPIPRAFRHYSLV